MDFAVEGFLIAQRYLLIRKIGSGGMGAVWLAHDRSLDRPCALKLLDPSRLGDPEALARFAREARTTGQIHSPNVVEVFEHGVWDGVPFIVMEFLEGEDLGTKLERLGKLRPSEAYSIIAQVARGLVRAHAIGIVHRDLKPENVFLVPDDGKTVVKVLDFGIAHHDTYSPRDHATKAGAMMGTPCYMSPEQALGKNTDWRSDLWTLGVLAFQCLTGRLPFTHDALGGLMVLILQAPIPKLREHDAEFADALEVFWQRASQREPARRFQSAGELSDALGAALGIDEILAVPSIRPGSIHVSSGNEVGSTAPFDGAVEFGPRVGSDAPVALTTDALVMRFRSRWRRPAPWFWAAAVIGLPLSLFLAARRFEVVRREPETSKLVRLPVSVLKQVESPYRAASSRTDLALPPPLASVTPPPPAASAASQPKSGPATIRRSPRVEPLRNGSRDYGI